jgi:predicted nucleic acid-binding protein
MDAIFADAFYWIALLNPQDSWYEVVSHYRPSFNLITTDVVLDETLNFFSQKGNFMRLKAVSLYESIQIDSQIVVISTTPLIRNAAKELYKNRLDKGYSMTDCISMVVMKQNNIIEILTHDHHFTQEGFKILF